MKDNESIASGFGPIKFNSPESLIISAISRDANDVSIEINNNIFLTNVEENLFLSVIRTYETLIKNKIGLTIHKFSLKSFCISESPINSLVNHNSFGTNSSLIVDMQGIASLLFARCIIFREETLKKILFSLEILDTNSNYLRFGAAGAPPVDLHPGGEVLEYSVISARDGSGISQSLSGFIPNNSRFSTALNLSCNRGKFLTDIRSVYSHTAWLCSKNTSNNELLQYRLTANDDNSSVLDGINELARKAQINSYSVEIYLQGSSQNKRVIIIGRVLSRIPNQPFKSIEELANIGYEEEFFIDENQLLVGYGSYYPRVEPEWNNFTNGRVYERRGHIHATLLGTTDKFLQHQVFHLRDIIMPRGGSVGVVLKPIPKVIRIYPIGFEKHSLCCKASKRTLTEILEHIC